MSTLTKQMYLEEQEDFFKIVITNGVHTIKSPLPDEIGITVGSEFASPFDTTDLSQRLQQAFAVFNVSRKVGIKMKRYYVNPELTEISFDMEFVAYYSTLEEVLKPVYKLMTMSVGRDVTWKSLQDSLKRALELGSQAGQAIAGQVGFDDDVQRLQNPAPDDIEIPGVQNPDLDTGFIDTGIGLLTLITGPLPVTLSIGNSLTLENVFVSSAAPRFSNILDPNGFPLSAMVSVTCILREAPTSGDGSRDGNIEKWFNGRNG